MFTPFSVTGCSLELLRTGERGIVTFCKSQDESILNELISIGVTPGATITLEQNFPSFLINIENTSLALDTESIQAIYVRIIDNLIN
ncbi:MULTISPECIES: FeoA family protein [unclassified Nostoc]|jgi:ferrous iron transport protein A|uniref:FeoA family protein n=1 Tax=unclassified Nostoc TaxID=2593658 RepID=UPI000DECABD9|nr:MULTISPECIES: FeoA family protein [unclassified Nostoc]MBD2505927.1 ferrous iron transport protein A [Desmonostoc muscorum FACHB-395]QHG15130.1 ferrous iron transport protein A [Nostoc sp. ATCC 53789]QLE47552.1 ferrous iron transport protein A [Nostoc sp. C057]RCJ23737.1 iron transporter FeoA [Nostoc sp. ATCC 53789]